MLRNKDLTGMKRAKNLAIKSVKQFLLQAIRVESPICSNDWNYLTTFLPTQYDNAGIDSLRPEIQNILKDLPYNIYTETTYVMRFSD